MTESSTHTYTTLIRDLPEGERPRERLEKYGADTLGNPELIAILLRTGMKGESVINMSYRLIKQFKGLEGMGRATFTELCALDGISEAKACQILAAFELGRRLTSLSPEERTTINSPRDVYNLLGPDMRYREQEHLRVLLVSTNSEVLGVHELYKGTVNSAAVRVAEVLRPAIRENCPSIIVVHNHPSGDPSPSGPDILITRQIKQAAELMDIELLDHIVIGGRTFVSMKDKGMGFS
ncbi:MAG: DNA repair protein RadC [Chloroflexi bacterium]|nr:DNA repair protein RadC [Chloroflexota bacterium]